MPEEIPVAMDYYDGIRRSAYEILSKTKSIEEVKDILVKSMLLQLEFIGQLIQKGVAGDSEMQNKAVQTTLKTGLDRLEVVIKILANYKRKSNEQTNQIT